MKSIPLLFLTTITLFSNPSFAANSSDSHSLSITAPEVRLLHIKNTPHGAGGAEDASILVFHKHSLRESTSIGYSAKGYYDITTNVEAGTSKTRSIMVSAAGLDKNWKLSLSSEAIPRALSNPTTLTGDTNIGELVSGISNIAMRNIEINYKLEPISSPASSSLNLPNQEIALTFTLTDDT